MNLRELHTLSLTKEFWSPLAIKDIFEAIMLGDDPQDLIKEIQRQCHVHTGYSDIKRDLLIKERFHGFVEVGFNEHYHPELCDLAIKKIAKLRGDYTSSFSSIIRNTHRFIGRTESGALRQLRDYGNLIKYSYGARTLFSEAIKHDDLEAATMMMASSYFSLFAEQNLHTLLSRAPNKNGACAALIKSKPESINEYVKTLHDLVMADNADRASSYYNKALTRMVGHEQVALLLDRVTKTSLLLLKSLMRDQADWYMGVCQKYLGHASYFDLYQRQPNKIAELAHFYKLVPKAERNQAIKVIWKFAAEEDVLAIADSHKMAAELHELTGFESLLPLTSNAYRRKAIENDLNI
jgi:hypothetical protein